VKIVKKKQNKTKKKTLPGDSGEGRIFKALKILHNVTHLSKPTTAEHQE
jgi:hypothetical protein